MIGTELPEAALLLLPLALATGLDPYLALLFLGAAPLLGWSGAEPGPLAELGTPPAVALAGVLYLAEVTADRVPWAATAWNVANTPVRMVASGLLCLLVVQSLPDTPASTDTLVSVAGGLVAGGVHLARTGWWLEFDLEGVPRRIRLLTAVVEDALVVALLFLALDQPRAGSVLGIVVLLVGAWRIRPHLTAGMAAHALVISAARGLPTRGRWRDGSALPGRIRRASGAADPSAHGVRSTRAAAWGPGVPGHFRRGWLVVGLAGPALVVGTLGRVVSVRLDGAVAGRIRDQPLHTVVDLVLPDGRPCGLAVSREGPGPEALRQVFGSTDVGSGTPGTLP